MLQWLRDNLKTFSWTLGLVIIAFVALYIPDLVTGAADDANTIATIGDEIVSMDEFRGRYQYMEQTYKQQLGDQATPELMRQLQLPLQVANSLIDERILIAEGKAMGLLVSDAELGEAILGQPVFQDEKGNFIGDEDYQRILSTNGFPTPASYEEGVRKDLLLQKVRSILAQNVYVPDSEVERSYREQVERAKVRYLQLPRSRFASEVNIAADELASYYAGHREEYRRQERRAISYLIVDVSRLRPQLVVSDEEIAAYHEANQAEFTREEQVRASHILLQADGDEEMADAERRLQKIRQRIEGGEDFATLAREFSEDTGSKARGGDLNFFAKGSMVAPFEEAAFGAQIGELVGPVRTEFGVHLIKVTAHPQGGVIPLDQASNGIRFKLQNQRAEPETESRMRALASRIVDQGLTTDEEWQALAEEFDEVIFGTSPPFESTAAIPGIGQVPALVATIFEAETGTVTDPVKAPRGWTLARVNEILEPSVPELTEIEPQVRQALKQERLQERVMERLRAAKEQIAAGESVDAVAAELDLEVKESQEFGRGTPLSELGSASAAISQAAFSMVEGEVGGPYADTQGATLIEVAERKQWDPSEFEENKDSTRATLENAEVERLIGAMVQKKRLELDVKFKRNFLDSFEIDPSRVEG